MRGPAGHSRSHETNLPPQCALLNAAVSKYFHAISASLTRCLPLIGSSMIDVQCIVRVQRVGELPRREET